jgi:hypothetical protein
MWEPQPLTTLRASKENFTLGLWKEPVSGVFECTVSLFARGSAFMFVLSEAHLTIGQATHVERA